MGTLNRATMLMMAIASAFQGMWNKLPWRKGKYDRPSGTVSKGSASKNKHPGACGRKGHLMRFVSTSAVTIPSTKASLIPGNGQAVFSCCRCSHTAVMKQKDWSDPVNWNWHRIARRYQMTVKEFASMVKANGGRVQQAIDDLNYMRGNA